MSQRTSLAPRNSASPHSPEVRGVETSQTYVDSHGDSAVLPFNFYRWLHPFGCDCSRRGARRHGVRLPQLPLPEGVKNDPEVLPLETLAVLMTQRFSDLASLLAIFDRTQADLLLEVATWITLIDSSIRRLPRGS